MLHLVSLAKWIIIIHISIVHDDICIIGNVRIRNVSEADELKVSRDDNLCKLVGELITMT
jgi:hypothetical protein